MERLDTASIENTIQGYWKWWGRLSRSVWQKKQSYVMDIATDLRYLANAVNCLYFVCDDRGLEPLIVQDNILIECRRMIHLCGTKKSGENPGWFLFIVIARLNLL